MEDPEGEEVKCIWRNNRPKFQNLVKTNLHIQEIQKTLNKTNSWKQQKKSDS